MTGENVSLRVAKALQAHRWPGRSWDSMDLDEQDHCLDLAGIAIDAAAGAGPADPPQQERTFEVEVFGLPESVPDVEVRAAVAKAVLALHHEAGGAGLAVGTSGGLRDPAPSPEPPEPPLCRHGEMGCPGCDCREPGPVAVQESPEEPDPAAVVVERDLLALSALLAEHRRDHLTDGDFHDGCAFCLHRRRSGGDGVAVEPIRRLLCPAAVDALAAPSVPGPEEPAPDLVGIVEDAVADWHGAPFRGVAKEVLRRLATAGALSAAASEAPTDGPGAEEGTPPGSHGGSAGTEGTP